MNKILKEHRKFFQAIFGLSVIIFLAFFVTATIGALVGYSLWNWMNVLRFFLGGAIFLVLCLYLVIIKGMLFETRLVGKRINRSK